MPVKWKSVFFTSEAVSLSPWRWCIRHWPYEQYPKNFYPTVLYSTVIGLYKT